MGIDKALQLRNLSVKYKVYEGTLNVIPGLDFDVNIGERVGLIGETGCGKTTILKAVAKILQSPPAIVSSDEILINGKKTTGRLGIKHVREQVSMIFQDPSTSLNPTLKVETQMRDILTSQFPEQKKEFKEMMMKALESVSMPAPERVLDSYPVQLSGGMRQRVCIAMALMKNTNLIIADEPTTALDVTIEEQILELLEELVKEHRKSLILVSHALGAVRKITDRVYVMYAGNIVEVGDTQQILANPIHPYTIGLIAATPKLTGEGIADGIAGELPSYLVPPPGCRFYPRCPLRSDACLEKEPKLEAIDISNPIWKVACINVNKARIKNGKYH